MPRKGSKTSKWAQQWSVPSDSGGESHVVSIGHEGAYACDCGRWKFARKGADGRRPDCHHIVQVKSGSYPPISAEATQLPKMQYANTRQVTPVRDATGRITEILIPLRPFDNSYFLATIAYDLLECGVPWPVVQKRENLPRTLNGRPTSIVLIEIIEQRSRLIYGLWQPGRGHVGFRIVRYSCLEIPPEDAEDDEEDDDEETEQDA